MFQMQRSPNEPNPTNLNSNTALPNNYGSVRTLKDDLAKLKSGKREVPEEPLPQSPIPQLPEIHPPSQPKTAAQPPAPEKNVPLSNINLPQKENSLEPGKGSKKSDLPDPFGSETFFQTRSPFDEKAKTPEKKPEKVPGKSSNKLIIILSFLFILALLGGGAYYWWFFMKPSGTETAPTAAETAPRDTAATTNNKVAESPNLKQWSLNPEADKIANKLAIERYMKNLAGTASQEKAVEIKLVSEDNQLITPQVFSNIFDFSLPASIFEKMTNDYSLFVSYENSEPRLGAAFKLTQSGNLSESLRSEEGDLFPSLKSFYLDKLPADTQVTFSSSKYKNADIRYFNFLSPANISLDYTVLSGSDSSYFIFSTSKNSIRAILDYMSEK
jgi:flagellar basal body-associated protein FliL